jgi:adenylate cyclase
MVARRRLRRTFGEFVSPEVVARVARDGATLSGELRTVSVLMSDVRGFTTMAERLPPAEVSETMNEYFTAMVDVILAHRGMVQDFIGDGILAVFGAPLDDADHPGGPLGARHAGGAGSAQRAVEGGRPQPPRHRRCRAHRAGLRGLSGSPRKKKYGVLGDTVNTAARIEGLNRELRTTILVSGAARAVLGDRVTARERGALPLKGKAEPVEVYEVIGLAGETEVRDATARGRSPE